MQHDIYREIFKWDPYKVRLLNVSKQSSYISNDGFDSLVLV